jgi:hypothetical protein
MRRARTSEPSPVRHRTLRGARSPTCPRTPGGRAAEATSRGRTCRIQEAARRVSIDRLARSNDSGQNQTRVRSRRGRADVHVVPEQLLYRPSSFCTDSGRAINNAGAPAISSPDAGQAIVTTGDPAWLATLPKGVQPICAYWKRELQPGGFHFSARIINFPGGEPGDVGLFFSWPKDALDAPP